MFDNLEKITFSSTAHSYSNASGEQYLSVNKMINKARIGFPKEKIAYYTAKRDNIKIEDVLCGWETKARNARNRGTKIHNIIQLYHDRMVIEDCNKEEYSGLLKELSKYFVSYARTYQEMVLYSNRYKVAGTADKVCIRSNRRDSSIIDIYDYKTGKESYSAETKKYYLKPLEYLEDCNYSHDCLQLSSYAFMLEEMSEGQINIGKLGIVYIDKDLKLKLVPVCYMKLEVELLFRKFGLHYTNVHNEEKRGACPEILELP